MRRFLLVLAVLALGFAPAPRPRPDRGRAERPRLFGTWTLKQVKHAGDTNYSGAGVANAIIYLTDEVTISDREIRVANSVRKGRQRTETHRIDIQVQTGVPHLDFLRSQRQSTLGLYRVEGKTLTIAYAPGASVTRPTSFDNPLDVVLIFERVR
jgi:uncharacterized protein (TIGR03067 family)